MSRRPPAAPAGPAALARTDTVAPLAPPLPGLRADGTRACVLTLSVQPGARRTEVQGWHDGALRVRLAAQPIEGQANAALTDWLAAELGIARRAVRLRRGAASRHKQVEIDLPLPQVHDWLLRRAGPAA